ncbi:hypothetical protein BpHYR1_054122 [Brachionus plicatilis]|uniref:Uncharacterized protein n=1 Tax=Brachionus plicatilis TaxID=10195 RepID=A0A3M7SN67_BRAPC|nr:hypothetical protein BpHYR1_054122 [Brachionus plicatilis]
MNKSHIPYKKLDIFSVCKTQYLNPKKTKRIVFKPTQMGTFLYIFKNLSPELTFLKNLTPLFTTIYNKYFSVFLMVVLDELKHKFFKFNGKIEKKISISKNLKKFPFKKNFYFFSQKCKNNVLKKSQT